MKPIKAFVIALCCAISCTPKQDRGHETVLQVNGSKMSAEKFAETLAKKLQLADAFNAKQPALINEIKNLVAEEFIKRSLILQYAHEHKLSVPTELVDSEVKRFRKSYPDDISFRGALLAQGLTLEAWKSSIAEGLLERSVLQDIAKDISKPTSEALKDYYKKHSELWQRPAQIKLRHIMLKTEEEARSIYAQLSSGGSFVKLAKEVSIAPEAEGGGDTDWIDKGSVDFFDGAYGLPKKGKSSIIKSQYGYHIVQLLDKRPQRNLKFESVKPQIERLLMAEKEREVFNKWLSESIRTAKILKNDSLIRNLNVVTK